MEVPDQPLLMANTRTRERENHQNTPLICGNSQNIPQISKIPKIPFIYFGWIIQEFLIFILFSQLRSVFECLACNLSQIISQKGKLCLKVMKQFISKAYIINSNSSFSILY
ncbi:hypothetical protein GOP47_0021139 [Adiantum capillus-veneris]|uniref:Uncharacterized protein n=1 Tax=Adiantum capillus-veneris TaxID=13818 RepID=A0A9D4UC47_ADICA|nr:hypothetical protein GOP47_0021139 [Adiantum capillus-veneris]